MSSTDTLTFVLDEPETETPAPAEVPDEDVQEAATATRTHARSNPGMTTLNAGVGEDAWTTVERLRDWLDAKDNATPDKARLLRLLKVQEEVGEVAQAAMGADNANPRKGRSHTWEDVQHELCDVILSSMVALATLTPEAAKVFQERLDAVAERSLT